MSLQLLKLISKLVMQHLFTELFKNDGRSTKSNLWGEKTYFLVNFKQCVLFDKTSGYLHELRSETMYYGTKRQTIPEGRRHILDIDIVVIFTLYSAPLLESLQRSHRIAVYAQKSVYFWRMWYNLWSHAWQKDANHWVIVCASMTGRGPGNTRWSRQHHTFSNSQCRSLLATR